MKEIDSHPFIITNVHNAIPTWKVLELEADLYIINGPSGYKIVDIIEPSYNGKLLIKIKQITIDSVEGDWTIYKVVGEGGEVYGFRTNSSVMKLTDIELEWIKDLHNSIDLTPYLHLNNTTQINLSASAHIHLHITENQAICPVHLSRANNGSKVVVIVEGIGTITHHEHPDIIYDWTNIIISPVEKPFAVLEFYKSNYKWYCTYR